MDLRNAYKNSWKVAWKMLNPVWTTIDWAKWKNQKFQEKRNNPTMNNYKSNLNLTTYNSRYPNFDEADYKKLEQWAINRGLTWEQKTQFMDEAYQYYYPQVLNQHWLDARAEEINKTTSEHGSAILNGDKTVEYNMKLIDLAQTFKRVKWVAYDYPDEQVIDALKTRIPDGEQLLLNYLNDGDDTILYKAGLKKTENQTLTDVYNARKDGINKALVGSWKELSGDGLKYLRDYTVIFQTVDEARKQWMGQGMSDNELLRNLMYVSPELQELEKEIWGLTLDNQDKRILWIKDSNAFHRWVDTVRDWLWWNWDKAATLDDIAQEMYVRENMDGQTWKNFLVNWRNAGDDFAKFTYRTQKDLDSWVAWLNHALMNKNLAQLNLWRKLTDEEYQQYIDELKQQEQAVRSQNINEVKEFNERTDQERESYKKKIWLDPIIENYYNNQWIIESIANQDIGWAWYKWVWEAAWNVDMLAWIAGSMVNPAIWMAIMWTDAYARENQEAFETLVNAQTKQWVPYEEAYNNARDWAVVVWLINTAIELWLEKVLGWVETTASKNLKEIATKSLNKEVTDMMARRWILDMLGKWLETQARSSLEEWLEEVFQQLVLNIAESWYDPDKQVSEWLWRAFESWALNPMNLLAWWSELFNNSNQIKQSMYNSAYDAGAILRNITDKTGLTKDWTTSSQWNVNTQWDVAVEWTEMVTEKAENPWVIDRITDRGAEKITNTVSAQDKLYKAQEPRMNVLSKKKDIEKRREHSDRANQLIVQNGYIPTNTAERLEAHENTMKNIWKQVEDRINWWQEIMVDLSQIADVLDEYIQSQRDTKSTLTEWDLAKLEKESQALRWQQVSLPVAERLKQLYNSVINNRWEEKASDTMANWLQKATHEIWVIEDNLLSEIPWEFQWLKNDFGALKDTYEDVFKADMKNQRKKWSWLTETYSRIEWIGDIANWLLGVATWKWDIASIWKGAAKFLVWKSLAKASDVDFLIEQWFKELAKQYGNNWNVTTNTTATTPTAPTTRTTTQITEDIDVWENPTDLTATEEVVETPTEEVITEWAVSENWDFSELSIDELKSRIDDERDPLWWTSDLWLDLDAEWRRRTDYYSNNPDELVRLVNEWVNSIAMKDFVQEATLKMLLQDNISAEVEKIGKDILKKLEATKTLDQEVTTTPKKKTTKKKTGKGATKLDTKKIASDYMKWEMDWNKYQHLAWLTEEQALEKRWKFEAAIDEEWDKNQDYYNTHQSELVEKFHHLLK